ncbi:MAG: hypothetical protein QOH58_220 [Thermoleophilaceae bacterium]|jgi:uncharacterized membrane protein (DUF373 family)|nr:hypothetical protein [Thermoleophilaceae bacterium]
MEAKPTPEATRPRSIDRPGRPFVAQEAIGRAQSSIYLVVAILLVGAAAFTLVGTVIDVIEGSGSRPIADTGLFILDRVLLLFIIAELLYTLRLIDVGGRILVEPFLFIGLIAVVRKILVVSAEASEGSELGTTRFLTGVGALAGLAFVLVLSIFLLRRSNVVPQTEAG